MSPEAPIGVFDSGVGGLTVVRALEETLPSERILYLGDTARVPYGNKSQDTIQRYSREISRYLCSSGVKMIVVACNTASAFALEVLRAEFPVPVLGVIEPGVQAALAASGGGRIGIIGTSGTIGSGVYQRLLRQGRPDLHLHARATPLLVPLIEEDWIEHAATRTVLEEYLRPMMEDRIDTLVLACTHYPLLRQPLAALLGPSRVLVDSAHTCAGSVRRYLQHHQMLAPAGRAGGTEIVLTDIPHRFQEMAARFLRRDVAPPLRAEVDAL